MNEEAYPPLLDTDLFEITENITFGEMSVEQAVANQEEIRIKQLKAEAKGGRVDHVALTAALIEIQRRFKNFRHSLMDN